MNINMDARDGAAYVSATQKIRIITETWAARNLYCPCCGHINIARFQNNKPVADFFCPKCQEEYELKSKEGKLGGSIIDGAYNTMINRIRSINNPNFLFLNYRKADMRIQNFIFIPKYYFTPDVIEKRKPLSPTARRAGWTGCNICIDKIPKTGWIYLIDNERPLPPQDVLYKFKQTNFIRNYKLDGRGWMLDVLTCIQKIPTDEFFLSDMYEFERDLQKKYPSNHHIKEKIRQQLQLLRDKNIVRFVGNGKYQKLIQ